MKDPRLSVLMSVYKEPIEWLKQSIDSILQQTFKDFEFIIVCDNPSYKDGIDLLRSYSDKDKRIVLLFNETNVGLTKSLNRGLAIARGAYIARMDADDISLPNRFGKQVSFLDNHDDIFLVGSKVNEIDSNGNIVRTRSVYNFSDEIRTFLLIDSPIVHPSVMFRRIMGGHGIHYDEKYRYAQDYALWVSVAKDYKMENLNDVLLNYRISESQISSKKIDAQNECARMSFNSLINNYQLIADDMSRSILFAVTRRTSDFFEPKVIKTNLIDFFRNNSENYYCNLRILYSPVLISLAEYSIKQFGKISTMLLLSKMICRLGYFNLRSFLVVFRIILF